MDIATLGIKIENGDVVKATASLEGMAVAGAKTEAATGRVTRRMALLEIEARKMNDAMGLTGTTMTKLTAAASAFSAIAAIGFIGRETIKNTIEAQNAMAQLGAAVASTGGAAGRTVAQLDALSMQLQKQTTYSDEAVKGAEAMLLTFDKIRGTEFDRATQAVADLAARMGTDLQSAAIQVGKALQDPEHGLTALRRSGVSFSAAQIEVIKKLYETGRVAEGQRVILAELEHQFGGSAAAARDTLGGAIKGLENAFGDLFEVTRGGAQGTVEALNAITSSLENSGLSMNTFMLNTMIGWNNITAAAEKFNNVMSIDLSKGLGSEIERVKALNARIDFDRNVEEARLRTPAKVGPAVGPLQAAGSDASAAALREAERLAKQLREAEERNDRAREREEQRYLDDINEIWDRGMESIVASTHRGFRAVLDSVNDFMVNLIKRMAKEGQSSFGLEIAQQALGGALAGGSAGLMVGGMTTSRVTGAIGGVAAGAGAGFMAGGPIGAAAGALAGLAGGIIGAGNAAREAAKAYEALRESVALSIEGIKATIAGDSVGVAIAAAKAQFAALRQQVESMYPEENDYTRNNPAWAALLEARKKALDEIDDLEAKRIAQLKAEGDAARSTVAAMLNLTNSYKAQYAIFNAINPALGASGSSTAPRLFAPPTSRTESTGQPVQVTLVMDGKKMGEAMIKQFGGRPNGGNPQTGFIDLVQSVQVS